MSATSIYQKEPMIWPYQNSWWKIYSSRLDKMCQFGSKSTKNKCENQIAGLDRIGRYKYVKWAEFDKNDDHLGLILRKTKNHIKI